MTNYNFETVDVPRGAFISWGTQTGQHVTGKVLEYNPTGGTDFAGNPCGQLSIELIEPAASINKAGERSDFPAGELVVLNCGQVSLKRAVRTADPAPGDVVKITLSNLVTTARGQVKEFSMQIARGAAPEVKQEAKATTAAPAAAAAPNPFASSAADKGQPPF